MAIRRTKLEMITDITKLTTKYKVSRLWTKSSKQLEEILEETINMNLIQVKKEEFNKIIERFTEGLKIDKEGNSIYYFYNGEIVAVEFHSFDIVNKQQADRYYIIKNQ